MKKLLSIAAAFCLLTAVSAQQKEIPPQADSMFRHIMTKARPAVNNWVKSTALKYRGTGLTAQKAQEEATTAVTSIAGLKNAGVEALSFLVMMQAAKTAGDDLKGIMGEVKAANDAKAKQRAALTQANEQKIAAGILKKDSTKLIQASPALLQRNKTDKADAINDMSEPQQLKLQQTIEQRNKMIEVLSNLLKKIESTEESIIGNLK